MSVLPRESPWPGGPQSMGGRKEAGMTEQLSTQDNVEKVLLQLL